MAVFPITGGTFNAFETAAGTVTATSNGVSHDHDQLDEYSALNFQTGGSGPPQAATILTAVLKLYISTTGSDEPNVTIKGEKVVNSGAFSGTNNIKNRYVNTPTTAAVTWVSANLGAAADQQVTVVPTTGTLEAIVQELVDQPTWTPSSGITLIVASNAPSSTATASDLQYRFYNYQGSGGTDPVGTYAPTLEITWSGGTSGSVITTVLMAGGMVELTGGMNG